MSEEPEAESLDANHLLDRMQMLILPTKQIVKESVILELQTCGIAGMF